MSFLRRIFPFLSWFEAYDLAVLRADFVAGLTVALVLVPQSMAYAQLAGLPPYYGLYAAFLPPLVASLFGSSRQLATGPVAVVSLMTSATLEPLATAGSESFIAYALLLALLVGLFQFALGALRLGVVINFLSHPVVNGFTNAAALIIATSQLSKIVGVHVDKAPHHYETIFRVIRAAFHYTHWPTVGMAAVSFAILIVLKRVSPRIPNVLIAVVVTTFVSWAVGFQRNETIDIRQFASAQVREQIRRFNEAIEAKKALETSLIESRTTWAELEDEGSPGLCLRCHGMRELSDFAEESDPHERPADLSDAVLLLHSTAGFIDEHIKELKHSISEYRETLRSRLFVRTEEPAAGPRFYSRDEAPEKTAMEGGTWRIKVGNSPLDPESIAMTGGGAVVGRIPEGLPAFRVPQVNWNIALQLLVPAMVISLLGFMEAISIAKSMAARTHQKLDANQELIGQGLANIVGCMGQSYAVSGSFSRSAVNLQAGAQTGMSNVFCSGVVMVVLLFFCRTLYHLPQAVLASIIMMAVVGLLNVKGTIHAWRANRFDGAVSVIAFTGTLVFAPHLEWGILIGVALSIGAYLYRSMRPEIVELAPRLDGAMRDAKRLGLKKCRYISVVSFQGPLNFASTNYLEGEILNRVAESPELRHLHVAGEGISEIDASGEETLRHLVNNLRAAGYAVSFSGMSERVLDVLRRSRLYGEIGEENFYGTQSQAIAMTYASAHEGTDERDCPYLRAMPPIVELSLHPDGSLRNAERHGLRKCRHIAVLRFDAPLSFANTAFLQHEILRGLADRPALRQVVLASHGISDIDDSGAQKLGDLVQKLRADGYAVSFSGLKEEVVDVLDRNRTTGVLGAENMYPTQPMAIAAIYAQAHGGSSEEDCPLRSLAPRLTELSLDDDGVLRDAAQRNLRLCNHIALLRFDGPLALRNRKAIQSEFIQWAKTRPSVRNVVFLADRLDKLDANEQRNLIALVKEVREAGYRVVLANLSDQAFEDLATSKLADLIGPNSTYPTDTLAIAAIMLDAHAHDPDEDCPLQDLLPRLTELSLHEDGSLRDAHRYGLALCRRIAVVRFEGPLNFATIGYFEKKLRQVLERRPSVTHILVAGDTLAGIDTLAAEEFHRLSAQLRHEGYSIYLSGLKDDDVEVLGIADQSGSNGVNGVFPTQAVAIERIYAEAHRDSDEDLCPLRKVVRYEP